jgi:hypothetical protein
MRYIKYLALVCVFCGPQLSFAAENEHQYTAKDQIRFSPETGIAFDRTGKFAVSRTLADGSTITELNGSMRSVTVARMGPDGKVETYCTSDAEAARSWMAGEFDTQAATIQVVPDAVQ